MTPAEVARREGWRVGDELDAGPAGLRITAIGEVNVLAVERGSRDERALVLSGEPPRLLPPRCAICPAPAVGVLVIEAPPEPPLRWRLCERCEAAAREQRPWHCMTTLGLEGRTP